jgi:hypothetical protein
MDPFVPMSRAARIVAPISEGFQANRFGDGQFYVLAMLGDADIKVNAKTRAPPFPRPETLQGDELSKAWFSSIQNQRIGSDYSKIADWNRQFIDWMRESLLVCHTDIRANLKPPAGEWHAPMDHVDTAGATWNFPEALAWIATRDPLEVARMRYAHHWDAPIGDDDERRRIRALMQNDSTRSRMIGWLVLITANSRCKCGSAQTDEQEAWETCECVGHAYDELHRFATGRNLPIPEYQPQPAYASFTLTWPDGAHNLRFTRAEIIEKWSAEVPVATTRWIASQPIIDWWTEKRFTNGKKALKAFMKEPGTKGRSATFESLWKSEHPNAKRGRPKVRT